MLRNTIPTTIYDLLPAINVGAFLRLIFHRRLLERHAERQRPATLLLAEQFAPFRITKTNKSNR